MHKISLLILFLGCYLPGSALDYDFDNPHSTINTSTFRLHKSRVLSLSIGPAVMPWFFDNSTTLSWPESYHQLAKGLLVNTSFHNLNHTNYGSGIEHTINVSWINRITPTKIAPAMYMLVSENIRQYINYLGPSFLYVQKTGATHTFFFRETLSTGLLFYRMESQQTYPSFDQTSYTEQSINTLLSGYTMYAKLGVSFEYKWNRHLAIGLGAGYLWALMTHATYRQHEPNKTPSIILNDELAEPINLSQLNLSMVLRYLY